ncbi:reverse transcriptase domain-containing protein [Tanacetum coccineum]
MKEVQSLNGKLAGLNRFLSKSADKSLPLFKTLKKCTKKGDFRWTTEAEEAFTLLKQHIAALPTLVAPRPGEELIIYLSATHGAISAVLLTDRDSVQTPVYFVSKALKETEINYSAMEKLILALVFAAKRLRRYFIDILPSAGLRISLYPEFHITIVEKNQWLRPIVANHPSPDSNSLSLKRALMARALLEKDGAVARGRS